MRISINSLRTVIRAYNNHNKKRKTRRELLKQLKGLVKSNSRYYAITYEETVELYFYLKKQPPLNKAETVLLQPIMQQYATIDTPSINHILTHTAEPYQVLYTFYILQDYECLEDLDPEITISILSNYVTQKELLEFLKIVITHAYTPALILKLLALFPDDASIQSLTLMYKGPPQATHRDILQKSLQSNFCNKTITALLGLTDFDEIIPIHDFMLSQIYSILVSQGLNLESLILCSIQSPQLDLMRTIEKLFFKFKKFTQHIKKGMVPITQNNLDLILHYATFFADSEVCDKIYDLLLNKQKDFIGICSLMQDLDQTNAVAKNALILRLNNLTLRNILKNTLRKAHREFEHNPVFIAHLLYKYLNNFPFNTTSAAESLVMMLRDQSPSIEDPLNFYLRLSTYLEHPGYQPITRLMVLLCIFLQKTKNALPFISHQHDGYNYYLPLDPIKRLDYLWPEEETTLQIRQYNAQIHPAEVMVHHILKDLSRVAKRQKWDLETPSIELENIYIDVKLLDPHTWHILVDIFDHPLIKSSQIMLVGDLENLNLEKKQLLTAMLQHPKLNKLTLQDNSLNKASENVWKWLTDSLSTKLYHLKLSNNHLQHFSVMQFALLSYLINKLQLTVFDMSHHCFLDTTIENWRIFCSFLTTFTVRELIIQDLLTPWQASNRIKVFPFCQVIGNIKCNRLVSDLSVMSYAPDLLISSLLANFDLRDLSLEQHDMREQTCRILSRNERLYQAVVQVEQISQSVITSRRNIRLTIREINALMLETTRLDDSVIVQALKDRITPLLDKLHFYLFETYYMQHLPLKPTVANHRQVLLRALPAIINDNNEFVKLDTSGAQLLDNILLTASAKSSGYTPNAQALSPISRVKLVGYIVLQHLHHRFNHAQKRSRDATPFNLFARSHHSVLSIIDAALVTIVDHDNNVLDLKLWDNLIIQLKVFHHTRPLLTLAEQVRALIEPFSRGLSDSHSVHVCHTINPITRSITLTSLP